MDKMSIRKKILTGFAISIIVTVLSCFTILAQLQIIDSKYSDTLEAGLPQTNASAELSRLAMAQATLVQNYIMGKDTTQSITMHREEVNQHLTTLEKTIDPKSQISQELLLNLREKFEVMNNSLDEAISIKNSRSIEQASNYYVETAGMNVIYFMDDATKLTAEIYADFEVAQKQAQDKAQIALIITIIAIIIAIATGVIASIMLSKRIARPMTILQNHVQEITNGNLNIDSLKITSKDEIGHLAHAMNEMKETLSSLLHNLSDNATHLSATSQELMASTQEVTASSSIMRDGAKNGAISATMIASSASESAIAMDETALAIQRIAETSQDLHNFATQTEDLATVGSDNIHQASNQMSSIYASTKLTTELIQKLSQQSKEIESITQVITSITDQTNLLALNAAIEAARAGEHGKGFAVVADEVRKLAEESKSSAGQIVSLTTEIQNDTKNVERAIEVSLKNVEQGVDIIDRAGDSFDEIVGAIGEMKTQIAEVSAVTEEISATSEQVAASVLEISRSSEVTKESAEHAYQASEQQLHILQGVSSVSQDLSNRAQALQQVVSDFKV